MRVEVKLFRLRSQTLFGSLEEEIGLCWQKIERFEVTLVLFQDFVGQKMEKLVRCESGTKIESEQNSTGSEQMGQEVELENGLDPMRATILLVGESEKFVKKKRVLPIIRT